MFRSVYPLTRLRHPRVLGLVGRERGVVVFPKPFGPPPPEFVHRESVIVPLPTRRKVFVIEWTGAADERHEADV